MIGASLERDVADSLLRSNQRLKISDGLQKPCDKGMGHANCNWVVLGICRQARISVQASMSTKNTNEAASCRLLLFSLHEVPLCIGYLCCRACAVETEIVMRITMHARVGTMREL